MQTSQGGTKLGLLDAQASWSTRSSVPPTVTISYGTKVETRALHVYQQRIGPFASVYFKHQDLWTYVLPQASWSDPAIKHAMVAVATAEKLMNSALVPQETRTSAVRHYDKAIRSLTTGSPSIPSLLMVSILAWLYEMVSENPEIALMHARAAQKIVQQTQQSRSLSLYDSETADLAKLMDSINISAQEGEAQTLLYFYQKPGPGSEESPHCTLQAGAGSLPPAAATVMKEMIEIQTAWTPDVVFESLTQAIKVLEGILHFLLSHSNIILADASVSWQLTSYLLSWIHSFRLYYRHGPEPTARKQTVHRLYSTTFVIVQIQLEHRKDEKGAAAEQCSCKEKLKNIGSVLQKMRLEDAHKAPEIKECLALMCMANWAGLSKFHGDFDRRLENVSTAPKSGPSEQISNAPNREREGPSFAHSESSPDVPYECVDEGEAHVDLASPPDDYFYW